MAESDISISEMTNGTFSAGALFPAIQPSQQSASGYSNVKMSGADIGDGIGQLQFPLRLETENKSIFGAINEAAKSIINFLPIDTASGPVASFPDGANNIPCPSVLCTINPVQSGSGDPSPSNVRPITGHTELNLVHTGKNLFGGLPLAEAFDGKTANYTIDTTNKYFTYSNSIGTDPSIYSGFKPNTRYTFIFTLRRSTASGSNTSLRIKYTDNTAEYFNVTSDTKTTFVIVTASGKSVADLFITYYANQTTECYYDESGIFEGVLTAEDFVAYTGSTTTTALGTTVYGGTLEVETGVLTTTHASKTFTGASTESWTNVLGGFNIIISDAKQIQTVKCDTFKGLISQSIGNLPDMCVAFANSGALNCNFKDSNIADLTAWKNFLSSNPVTVCYELATPITTQLTPQEVKSLLGSNSFYHDCNGQVAVTYRADIGLYIDKKTT